MRVQAARSAPDDGRHRLERRPAAGSATAQLGNIDYGDYGRSSGNASSRTSLTALPMSLWSTGHSSSRMPLLRKWHRSSRVPSASTVPFCTGSCAGGAGPDRERAVQATRCAAATPPTRAQAQPARRGGRTDIACTSLAATMRWSWGRRAQGSSSLARRLWSAQVTAPGRRAGRLGRRSAHGLVGGGGRRTLCKARVL